MLTESESLEFKGPMIRLATGCVSRPRDGHYIKCDGTALSKVVLPKRACQVPIGVHLALFIDRTLEPAAKAKPNFALN